jgi:hypothetical protein
MKTGLLDVRPVFLRKEERTRGHVFCTMPALKITREIKCCLRTAFGTTDTNAGAMTLADALTALSRLCLLRYTVEGDYAITRLPLVNESWMEILKANAVNLPSK